MAGHSHSANVKHRKDRVNAAKAKVFSKCARMITVAARLGGPDPDANARLRLAIDKARMASMPKDNIERAVKKGAGGGEGENYEEVLYEGYAPCGVAVMLECLTDNRNRTAPEVRKLFEKHGGKLGSTGEASRMFERKGVFVVPADAGADEDQLMEAVLESGAEDLVSLGDGGGFEIQCQPTDFDDVRTGLETAKVPIQGGEVRYLATMEIELDNLDDARKVVRLFELLEDHDDVQSAFANFKVTDEVAKQLADEE